MKKHLTGSGDCGTMAAVIGDGVDTIKPQAKNVWVANINSCNQVVLTGSQAGIAAETRRLEAAGMRVVQLTVGGAFHSPYMKKAAQEFTKAISQANFKQPQCEFFSNVTAKPYPSSPEAFKQVLSQQMTSSVQFVDQVRAMYASGIRVFIEFGPRRALSKFIKNILK